MRKEGKIAGVVFAVVIAFLAAAATETGRSFGARVVRFVSGNQEELTQDPELSESLIPRTFVGHWAGRLTDDGGGPGSVGTIYNIASDGTVVVKEPDYHRTRQASATPNGVDEIVFMQDVKDEPSRFRAVLQLRNGQLSVVLWRGDIAFRSGTFHRAP